MPVPAGGIMDLPPVAVDIMVLEVHITRPEILVQHGAQRARPLETGSQVELLDPVVELAGQAHPDPVEDHSENRYLNSTPNP